MFLLSGVARYLFVPLAEAVVFAMLTSYVLSRTLVPTLAKYWLRTARAGAGRRGQPECLAALPARLRGALRAAARPLPEHAEHDPASPRRVHGRVPRLSLRLDADATRFSAGTSSRRSTRGQIKLHVRGPTGLRVEDTAALVDHVEAALREVIPASEIASIVDNIGLPVSGINLTYGNSGTVGSSDADILSRSSEDHAPTADYVRTLRAASAAGISRHELRLPARGYRQPDPEFRRCRRRSTSRSPGPARRTATSPTSCWRPCATCRGSSICASQQVFNQPELRVTTDRSRAQQLGISQHDVANNLLLTLSGSGQIAPTFWLNPETGLQYPLVAQAPQYRMASLQDLQNLPVDGRRAAADPRRPCDHHARLRARRRHRTTTRNRSSISTAPRRTAISARSAKTSRAQIAARRRQAAQGHAHHRRAARCRP